MVKGSFRNRVLIKAKPAERTVKIVMMLKMLTELCRDVVQEQITTILLIASKKNRHHFFNDAYWIYIYWKSKMSGNRKTTIATQMK